MNRTKIPWVRNPDGSQGYTWNILTGCFGPGGTPDDLRRCPYCYAHKLANGRLRARYLLGDAVGPPYPPISALDDPFFPRFRPTRLDEPLKVKKPSSIFVCSMGEVFSYYYPPRWLEQILHVVEICPQHRFFFLTKTAYFPQVLHFPDNVWCGVTITKGEDWARLLGLQFSLDASKKFISFEPLLDDAFRHIFYEKLDWLDWIIIGAQTKPYLPPKKEWVEGVMDEADRLGIPVFLKDNLKPLMGEKLRQEFPSRGGV